MKTYHLIATAAMLMLAGCSQNEITEISPDANPPVSFDIYTGAQTKGVVTDNSAAAGGIKVAGKGFGILAYYTGTNAWSATGGYDPDFMWNQQVTYATSAWSYTPVKYWPASGDKISFFAYAPYSGTQTSGSETNGIKLPANNATAKPTITFSLADNPANMVDLVAGYQLNQSKQASAVSFTLAHLLSRVSFKAKLDAGVGAETGVYITGMEILGSTTNSSSKFYKSAVYDWTTGIWEYTGATKQAANYLINNVINLTPASAGGYKKSSVKISSTTAAPLFKTNQFLFLIPPTDASNLATGGGITANTDVKVKVSYDLVTVDSKLSAGYSLTSTSVTVSLPTGTLKRAKAYEYTLAISVNEVKVSVTDVTGWGTAESSDIP